MNAYGGFRELLGDIDFLEARDNGVVESLVCFLFTLDIIILDGLVGHFKKSLLSGFAGSLHFYGLNFQAIAGVVQ